MITNFLEMLGNSVFDLIAKVFGILPQMPFDLSQLENGMRNSIVYKAVQWLNYFVPVDIASGIIALWAGAMMIFISAKLAIRYSKGLL